MLYLLKAYGPKGQKIYKVGYTNSFENRISAYFTHNPFIELLATRDGDENLENLIHICLRSLGYDIELKGKHLDEWFIGDINTISYVFHSSMKYLERTIWINRSKAFTVNNIKNTNSDSFKFLRDLYRKYNKCSSLKGQEFILDKNKKIINTGATDLDLMLFKRLVTKFKDDIDINIKYPDLPEPIEKDVQDFLDNKFYSTGIFKYKMKWYCEFMDKYK